MKEAYLHNIKIWISLLVCVAALAAVLVYSRNSIPKAQLKNNPSGIPRLTITTVKQGDDATAFLTEPVAEHISNDLSSFIPDYVVPPAPYYEDCIVSLDYSDGGKYIESAGAQVKVRGNYTTTYPKKSMRIRFDEKQSMLGLNHGKQMKNWLLLAEYKDRSMLRDKTALYIAGSMLRDKGLYAADSTLVDVEVNGQYWGVYLLTEQQQINRKRINIKEPEEDYEGTDIGYLLEADYYYREEDDFHKFAIDYAGNAPLFPYDGKLGSGRMVTPMPEDAKWYDLPIGISIDSDIYSQQQHDFIMNYLNNVYYIMYYAAYRKEAYCFNEDYSEIYKSDEMTPQEAVERAVDIRSLADIYLISEIACDPDLFYSSFYMDVDFGKGADHRLRFEAPWDYDSSMGNREGYTDNTVFYAANAIRQPVGDWETINPWLAVLMYEDWYQDIIRDEWKKYYADGLFERAEDMIMKDSVRYEAAFKRNIDRWGLEDGEMPAEALACTTQMESAMYLKEWLHGRVEFLNGHWGQD